MARFKPVVKSARFAVSPFTPQQMEALGNVFVASQDVRLGAGLNVYDVPAMPLKSKPTPSGGDRGYLGQKLKKGLKPIRDWWYTGRTRRSIKVLQADENRVVIGATDAVIDKRIAINNARERQFGVSPKDQDAIVAHVSRMEVITVKTSVA